MRTIKLLFPLLFSFLCSNLNAQGYWKTYSTTNGLPDSAVTDLAVGPTKVFLATASGLSVFDGTNFENFTKDFSDLNSNRIHQIVNLGDEAWFVTDSGISKYSNGIIQNFTEADGLLSDTIRDIAVNSLGDLYIATDKGLSILIGDQFTNEPSRNVYELGINGGDSIYAVVNYGDFFFLPSLVTVEMFDGVSWTAVRDNNFTLVLKEPELMRLSNGEVGIISAGQGAYLIEDGFDIQKIDVPEDDIAEEYLFDFDIDENGTYWMSYGSDRFNYRLRGGIMNGSGMNWEYFYESLPNPAIYALQYDGGKIHIGTRNGYAVASDTLTPFPRVYALENDFLKIGVSSAGHLFEPVSDDIFYFGNGWEMPKNSRRGVMDGFGGSGIWLLGKDQNNNENLAIQGFVDNDFGAGALSNNSTPVRPNLYFMRRDLIVQHIQNWQDPSYQIPYAIVNWPANGVEELGEAADIAPFVDANLNGCYDPENGDYPWILGDQAVYVIINDGAYPDNLLTVDNMNIEVHLMAYIFEDGQQINLDQNVFARYTIVNRSQTDYAMRAMNSGIFETGTVDDIRIGCDPSADIAFGYSGDNFNESVTRFPPYDNLGYDSILPAVGMKYINTDMQTFSHYTYSSSGFDGITQTGSSFTIQHYLNRFNSLWRDSMPYVYGNNGYIAPFSRPTNFIFSGDPLDSNSWNMRSLQDSLDTRGFWGEFIAGTRSFQLNSGERHSIDLVYSVAYDSSVFYDELAMIPVLKDQLNKAANFQKGYLGIQAPPSYSSCFVGVDENLIMGENQINLFPNPTTGKIFLQSNSKIQHIQIYTLEGKLIYHQAIKDKRNEVQIEFPQEAVNGLYLIRVSDPKGEFTNKKLLLNR